MTGRGTATALGSGDAERRDGCVIVAVAAVVVVEEEDEEDDDEDDDEVSAPRGIIKAACASGPRSKILTSVNTRSKSRPLADSKRRLKYEI